MHFEHLGELQVLQPILGYRRLRELLEHRYGSPVLVERNDDFGELLRIGKTLVAVQNFNDKLSIIMFDGQAPTEKYVALNLRGINEAVDHVIAIVLRNDGLL